MTDRYEGPIEQGMVLTAPDNDGRLGFRRVLVLAPYLPDPSYWIIEDLPSRMRGGTGYLGRIPEANLRIVFVPESQ